MQDCNVPEGFKMTEIVPLPEEWELMELGGIVDVRGDRRLSKGHSLLDEVTPYPYIRIVDFANHSVNLTGLKYLAPEDHEVIERYIITSDDVYISIAGTIGIVGAIPEALDGANLTENAARLVITDKSRLDKYYLVGYLSSAGGRRQIELRTTKTSQPKLALTRIKQIPIPLPPLPEQKNIATVLSAIQDAKEKTEAVINAARELKKSLMKHLFTYGPLSLEDAENVPLKETEIGLLPEEWDVGTIGDLTNTPILNGAFIRRDHFGIGTLFLNVVDIYESAVANLQGLERVRCSKEDIIKFGLMPQDVIFVRSSLKYEGVGQCCLIEEVAEDTIYDCHLMRLRPDTSLVVPMFLTYYCLGPNGKHELVRRSKKTTMTTINQKGLSNVVVPLPTLHIQHQIANILSAVDRKIEAEGNKKKALDELFKTMLQLLMTGRIRVNQLEMESCHLVVREQQFRTP